MGINSVRAIARPDYPMELGPDAVDSAPNHPLDHAEAKAAHGRIMGWYQGEMDRQASNRFQQAIDEDFYDSLQWSEEDAEELKARGQAPLVINQVKPTVDWVIGTEKRTRVDFKVLPREDDDTKGAEVKTKLLKYLSDVNRTPFARSRAFADAVKAGVGWIEVGIRDEYEAEPVYARYESWRNVIYDSNSNELDLSDARYVFRHRWVDVDAAILWFPDRAARLRAAASGALGEEEQDDLWYLGSRMSDPNEDWKLPQRRSPYTQASPVSNRSRVKLIEAWYREPAIVPTLVGSLFNGEPYDEANPAHREAVFSGASTVAKRRTMRVRVAVMTEDDLLYISDSPYRHNRFPFVPTWCYRRGRDHAPYGIIRSIRDPQEDLNKRASKALFILSSQQIIADEGAVHDWDALRSEASRPDGIIVKRPGKELAFHQDKQLAESHLRLMDLDARIIREVSSVTSENLGRETNATSGKAILARQEQGAVVTAEVFDNYRLAGQIQGEIELSLIEQAYTQPKVLRLTNERGAIDWVPVNKVQPDGTILNDITARAADFVISEQDYRASLRQAMFEQMVELVGRLPPETGLQLLDLIVELADVPNKEEIARRIRQLNGQPDPAQSEPTPEEQQAIQAQQQKVAEAEAMARQVAQLALEEQQAKVAKLNAEAQETMARIQQMLNPPPQPGAPVDPDPTAAMRLQYEAKVEEVVRAAAEGKAALLAEVTQLKQETAARIAEVRQEAAAKVAEASQKSNAASVAAATELAKARIDADATVRVAEISAADKAQTDALMSRVDALADLIKGLEDGIAQREKDRETKEAMREKDREVEETRESKERENGDGDGGNGQALTAAISALTAVVGEISKPKVLLRDKDGKPVGVKSVGMPEEERNEPRKK